MVAAAVIGSTVVGGVMSSSAQSDAADTAAGAQTAASNAQIAESRRQFDSIQQLLSPYTEAGPGALEGQQDILGLRGPAQQQAVYDYMSQSPAFLSMAQQGENAMLQNASATGGLRGGNTQGALAQFRPQLLNQMIDQQYQRLGGLATMGQNSAAGVGAAGQNSSNQIIAALGQQGAAQAGQALAQGQAGASLGNSIASAGGMLGSYLYNKPATTVDTGATYGLGGGGAVATTPYGFGGTSTFGQPSGGFF